MNGRKNMSNVPASFHLQLAALRNAFGDAYTFDVIVTGDTPRFEAVAKDDRSPWCLISTSASEIWDELKDAAAES